MKTVFTLLLCLAASVACAYEGTSFQALIEAGYMVIQLAKENSAEISTCLNYSGPKLDQQWKPFSFVFTPQADGTVLLRFGPDGTGDIPFYYDQIQVNGIALDSSAWTLYPPTQEGGRIGAVVSGANEPLGLRIYSRASRFIKVQKGQRTEVTMRGKSGSVFDAYINRLSGVKANLDEAIKIGAPLQGSTLKTGRELERSLNVLIALSESRLHVSVPPLALDAVSLEALKAKTIELIGAYDAEKARTASEANPCLYDHPEVRAEIKKAILPAVQLSSQLQTGCLLEFMLRGERRQP